MIVDDEIRFRAVQSRDARFDGKFFTAVMTTGVYCRPICPAKTPLRKNVRFFSCAAAAEEAGFRPCKRCRPESAPGTPVWDGTASSVSRGVRLIDSGFLEEHSVEELAMVLGIGSRHLRRLFVRHLGASPKALDLSRRTHFAAQLLSQTSLPITSIALDSGFRSIRQFNEVFKQTFALSPSEVRRSALDGFGSQAAGTALRLSYRPPFDWKGLLAFYSLRAIPGMEFVSEDEYCRSFSIMTKQGPASGTLSVTHSPEHNAIVLRVSTRPVKLSAVAARIRSMLDLAADPQIISDHLSREPNIAELLRRTPGIRIPGYFDSFEAAVRAVVGQQITVRAAIGLIEQLVRLCGEPLPEGEMDSIHLLFPTPRRLYEANLDSLGMPAARKKALKALARAWLDGNAFANGYRSSEVLRDALQSIDGVGPWTAEYTSLRGFAEPDAFPASDIVLRAAVGELLGKQEYATVKEVGTLAEDWRPWRGYAAQLLWQSRAHNAEENERW